MDDAKTVHIVIHRLWITDSDRRVVVYVAEGRGPGLVTVCSVGSRVASFLSCRHSPLHSEMALPEANSFRATCQQFRNIGGMILEMCWSFVKAVTDEAAKGSVACGLT